MPLNPAPIQQQINGSGYFDNVWIKWFASLQKQVNAVELHSYTVATLPSAALAGQMVYVSNEAGGAVPAFSDGTNWRRVTDRAIVS
jgi:hypothetical protein